MRWQLCWHYYKSIFGPSSSSILCYPFEKSEGIFKETPVEEWWSRCRCWQLENWYRCTSEQHQFLLLLLLWKPSMRNSIPPFLSTACKCKAYWSKRSLQQTYIVYKSSNCLWSSTSNLTVIEFVPIRHVFWNVSSTKKIFLWKHTKHIGLKTVIFLQIDNFSKYRVRYIWEQNSVY